MLLDLASRHPARIQREDFVVEAFKAGLPFGNDLRLEGGIAVARNLKGQGAEVAFESLLGVTIARIATARAFGVVLFVAEVMSEFSLESAFENSFGELFEQA